MEYLRKSCLRFDLQYDYRRDEYEEKKDSLSRKELSSQLLPSLSTGWKLSIPLKDRTAIAIYSPSSFGAGDGKLEVQNLSISGTDEEGDVAGCFAKELIERIRAVQFDQGRYNSIDFCDQESSKEETETEATDEEVVEETSETTEEVEG